MSNKAEIPDLDFAHSHPSIIDHHEGVLLVFTSLSRKEEEKPVRREVNKDPSQTLNLTQPTSCTVRFLYQLYSFISKERPIAEGKWSRATFVVFEGFEGY